MSNNTHKKPQAAGVAAASDTTDVAQSTAATTTTRAKKKARFSTLGEKFTHEVQAKERSYVQKIEQYTGYLKEIQEAKENKEKCERDFEKYKCVTVYVNNVIEMQGKLHHSLDARMRDLAAKVQDPSSDLQGLKADLRDMQQQVLRELSEFLMKLGLGNPSDELMCAKCGVIFEDTGDHKKTRWPCDHVVCALCFAECTKCVRCVDTRAL